MSHLTKSIFVYTFFVWFVWGFLSICIVSFLFAADSIEHFACQKTTSQQMLANNRWTELFCAWRNVDLFYKHVQYFADKKMSVVCHWMKRCDLHIEVITNLHLGSQFCAETKSNIWCKRNGVCFVFSRKNYPEIFDNGCEKCLTHSKIKKGVLFAIIHSMFFFCGFCVVCDQWMIQGAKIENRFFFLSSSFALKFSVKRFSL